MDKIREAVGLGGPVSLSSIFVGGGDGKRGINGLKTPFSHKKEHTYDVGLVNFIYLAFSRSQLGIKR